MRKNFRLKRYFLEYRIYIKTHYDLYRLIDLFITIIDLEVISYILKQNYIETSK